MRRAVIDALPRSGADVLRHLDPGITWAGWHVPTWAALGVVAIFALTSLTAAAIAFKPRGVAVRLAGKPSARANPPFSWPRNVGSPARNERRRLSALAGRLARLRLLGLCFAGFEALVAWISASGPGKNRPSWPSPSQRTTLRRAPLAPRISRTSPRRSTSPDLVTVHDQVITIVACMSDLPRVAEPMMACRRLRCHTSVGPSRRPSVPPVRPSETSLGPFRSGRRGPSACGVLAQRRHRVGRAQLAQRLALDLPDPLPGQSELRTDIGERVLTTVEQAEPSSPRRTTHARPAAQVHCRSRREAARASTRRQAKPRRRRRRSQRTRTCRHRRRCVKADGVRAHCAGSLQLARPAGRRPLRPPNWWARGRARPGALAGAGRSC